MGCVNSKITPYKDSTNENNNSTHTKKLSTSNKPHFLEGEKKKDANTEESKNKAHHSNNDQPNSRRSNASDAVEGKRKQNIIRISLGDQDEAVNDNRMKIKRESQRELIERAIKDSDVLCQFSLGQKNVILDHIYIQNFKEGDLLINAGDKATAFFVVDSGSFEITDKDGRAETITTGDTFGDINLLHINPSEITVRALSDGTVWMITAHEFIFESSKLQENMAENTVKLLKDVPLFQSLTDSQVSSIQSMLQTETFEDGEYIIKKGEKGNKLYIIKFGEAICDSGEPASAGKLSPNRNRSLNEIRRLHNRDYFGEIALMYDIERTINVISSGRTECWVLKREVFSQILGSLEDILMVNTKRKLLDSTPIFKPLSKTEKDQLVPSVNIEEFDAGNYVVRQGEKGDKFYIIEKGEVQVNKDDNGKILILRSMVVGEHFGETALFTSEVRTANVLALSKTTVLSITRDAFIEKLGPLKELLQRKRIEEFFTSIKFFDNIKLEQNVIIQLIDAAKVIDFEPNTVILNQGESPNQFYIIESGSVISSGPKGSMTIHKGGYFGEQALLSLQTQRDKVITNEKCRCLVISGKEFAEIIQPLLYKFEDLVIDEILGLGGFALVQKVHPKDSNLYFALKSVSKTKLKSQSAQRNILNEKQLISKIYHPFLTKLVTTFQDDDYIYMLEEYIESGDLRTLMLHQRSGRFSDSLSKFYAAIIIAGLDHLHVKHIVYRDAKPENIMLCANGYIKIIDFGNAKEIEDRTYSLCGTPDYMAPELWLNEGHGIPCDYWAYGVMIYEFLNGTTPFEYDPEKGQSEQISRIIKGRVSYPLHFDPNATDLIRSLLKLKPRQRLGCMKNGSEDVKSHEWFRSIDWPQLLQQKIKPPFVPPQSYIEKCCQPFNNLTQDEIIRSTVDGKLTSKFWIQGF